MKLMMDIAHDYLVEKKTASLNEIFEEIKEQSKLLWKETFPGKLLSKIEVQKKGELFTYLTTDGRFVMPDNNNWALTENYTFDEVKKMRLNIGTTEE